MKIIIKYKKTFIAVVVVSLMIAFIPILSMIAFNVQIVSSVIGVTEVTETSSLEGYKYQSVNLKMDNTVTLEAPAWTSNRYEFKENSNLKNETKQVMLEEWYLEAGTAVEIKGSGTIKQGYVEYCLINESGVMEYINGSTSSSNMIQLTIETDGNYGILMNANAATGSSSVSMTLLK